MITISKHLRSEKGVAGIEATILLVFFVGMLIYTFQQCYVMTLTYSATKLSSQIAQLVSQRAILFSDNALSQRDIDSIGNFIPELKNETRDVDIYIEELSYHSGAYTTYAVKANEPQCTINKPLSSYGINLQTSFGKRNSLYRVTVCRKVTEIFFSDNDLIVSGITLLPGQHH
ncbi:hypothetical protein LXD80_12465 [Enterobacter sp. ASE]|uniref:tight adherence pilus pseudopilin TadF n=1 Tax=Enterobacter sp. ASE TaxID=2905968 RepID=UPI001E405A4E|nr:tight adherence pilus pseudopilin TadF [Enterobacter sp. ASE]MCE3116607.1 hypothetical protein [Enterobacter sp. ASE]